MKSIFDEAMKLITDNGEIPMVGWDLGHGIVIVEIGCDNPYDLMRRVDTKKGEVANCALSIRQMQELREKKPHVYRS